MGSNLRKRFLIVVSLLVFCAACDGSSGPGGVSGQGRARGTPWGAFTRNNITRTVVHTFLALPGDLQAKGHAYVPVDYSDILETSLEGLSRSFDCTWEIKDYGLVTIPGLSSEKSYSESVLNVVMDGLDGARPDLSAICRRVNSYLSFSPNPAIRPEDIGPEGLSFSPENFVIELSEEAGTEIVVVFCYLLDQSSGSREGKGMWPRATPFIIAEVPVLPADFPGEGYVPPFKTVLATAHELGHAFLGLIDSYGTPLNADALDIMSARNYTDPALFTTPYTQWNNGDPAAALPPVSAWMRLMWGYASATLPGLVPEDQIFGLTDIVCVEHRDPRVDASIPESCCIPAPYPRSRAGLAVKCRPSRSRCV
ncbi:MAG: hypothetical protein AB1921_05700 [Thermodesulfobacteriota bacterium]